MPPSFRNAAASQRLTLTTSDQEIDLSISGKQIFVGWSQHISRYAFAASFVRNKTVLDFGCGCGYGSALLKSAGAAAVVANDIASGTVGYAARHFAAPGVSYFVADCLTVPLPSEHVEIIVSFGTIDIVSSRRAFLEEAYRLMKPEGLLIVSIENSEATWKRTQSAPESNKPSLDVSEVRQDLGEHFSDIRIFGQSKVEGSKLFDLSVEICSRPRALVLQQQEDLETRPRTELFETFVAVCAKGRFPDSFAAHTDYVYSCGADEVSKLRLSHYQLQAALRAHVQEVDNLRKELEKFGEAHGQLEEEFAERSRWALSLDAQVAERDTRIHALQKEFDERSRWALSLDARVAERDVQIERIQAELDLARAENAGLRHELANREVQIKDLDR